MFSHPAFLALLLLIPAFIALAGRPTRFGRRLPRSVVALRIATAAMLVLALSGLRLPAPPRGVATVFVVDESFSVSSDVREAAKRWVRDALAKIGPDDRAAIVTFARDARVEMPLTHVQDFADWGEPPYGVASNVGGALALAADLLPPANTSALRRIVLLSDGNETTGDAQAALLQPALRDVEISTLALPTRLQDAAITGFSVPPSLRAGEPAQLRIAVYSPIAGEGTLRVSAIGAGGAIDQVVYDRPVALAVGSQELDVDVNTLAKGSWAFHATLGLSGDSRPENDESWTYTTVVDPARVLVMEGTPGEASQVRAALAEAGIRVDTMRPQTLPTSVDRLAAYQSIVLANVPATNFTHDQMVTLQQFVAEQGHGLVVIGGDRAYGLGEYGNTPLEAALPVLVQPPDQDQTASLAIVLVIDRSGSMSTADAGDRRLTRMDLAKEGAIQAAEALQPGDQVGVIAFDYRADWISRIHPINTPADQADLADRISSIRPEGGTEIYGALDAAYRDLQTVPARIKHIILLTDGEGTPAPYPQLVNQMRRAGITLSAVGVSSEAGTTLLKDLAQRGQGRYYFTNSPRDVPRIMTDEARIAGHSFREERDFKPRVVTPAPAVRGLVPADLPQIHGYVRVASKLGAEVVLSSDQEQPLLSEWQYGLGRAIAWMPDAQGPWSKDWVNTNSFKRLWPQAVRWTMPTPLDPTLQVSVTGDGEHAFIRVDAVERTGDFRNLLKTYADVVRPDGTGDRVPLPQTAPGRYEGVAAIDSPGAYFIRVAQAESNGQEIASQMTGYALPYQPEFRVLPPNRALLERLAADTGGSRLTRPNDAWRRGVTHRLRTQDVWDYCLMAALALFVADVAARRLNLSAGQIAASTGALARRVRDWRSLSPWRRAAGPEPYWRR